MYGNIDMKAMGSQMRHSAVNFLALADFFESHTNPNTVRWIFFNRSYGFSLVDSPQRLIHIGKTDLPSMESCWYGKGVLLTVRDRGGPWKATVDSIGDFLL